MFKTLNERLDSSKWSKTKIRVVLGITFVITIIINYIMRHS
jgi:hypothetical protein